MSSTKRTKRTQRKPPPPRPMQLRALLAQRGVRHVDVLPHVRQANGRPLSRTAFSRWMSNQLQLVNTSEEHLRVQVRAFLKAHLGMTDAELEPVFEPDLKSTVFDVAVVTMKEHPDDPEPVEPAMLNETTKRFFKLGMDPFQNDVRGLDDVWMSAGTRYISNAMLSSAKHSGLLAVVGESGAGKSILRRKFIEEIRSQRADIRVIEPRIFDKTKLHAAALCEAIIRDLAPGVSVKNSLEARANQVLMLLRQSFQSGCRHVMLIEEAHDMTIPMLKYLKRFWEMDEGGFTKLLSIILVAQPELLEKLDERNHPELREFIQRCEVATLEGLDETLESYLRFKFERVGVAPEQVLAPDAYQAIRERLTRTHNGRKRSLLHPLRVGNLVSHAMNEAAAAGEPLVSGDVIRGI